MTEIALTNAFVREVFNFNEGGVANHDMTGEIPITNALYLSLHSASPAGGSQQTNELGAAPYTQYLRVGLVRTASGWLYNAGTSSASNSPVPASFAQRATAGGTDPIATYIGIGTQPTGAGVLLACAPLQAQNAPWLYGSSRKSVSADTVEVSCFHAGTVTFTDGDEYAFLPLYNDILPTAATSMLLRYAIKAGSLPGAASPYGPTALNTVMKFVAVVGGATLNFTSDGAFQLVKAAPLTITNGLIPTFNVAALKFTAT